MSGFRRDLPRNEKLACSRNGLPASKRPRISPAAKDSGVSSTEDEDPFADDDDITGEEWEFIASQAEIKLTQDQAQKVHNAHKLDSLVNGISFKAPKPLSNNTRESTGNALIKELHEKLALHERKVKELEQLYKRKEGEAMVLRDRLSTTEKHLSQEKMKLLEMKNSHEEAEAECEKRMQKEIEKFKDQVQFKQAEILESQNMIRNLEAKNKLLEQQRAGIRNSATSTSSGGRIGLDADAIGPQDSNHSAAKRIKLVKPESPRVSNKSLLNPPEFSDNPLGRKKGTKPSSSSPSKLRNEDVTKTKPRFTAKMRLHSKYLPRDFSDRLSGQELLRAMPQNPSGKRSSFLNLLDLADGSKSKEALNCLRGLVGSPADGMVFGNLCGSKQDVCGDREDLEALLSLLETSLCNYVDLQDSLSNKGILSQGASSFHTASSEIPTVSVKRSPPDISKICHAAHSTLQVLDVLISYSQDILSYIFSNNQVLFAKAMKMCDVEKWHPSLEMCEDTTNAALRVISKFAQSSNVLSLERFSDFVKADVLRPLLAHRCMEFKDNAITVLIPLTNHSPFVSALVREDSSTGSPSILCHICDLVCLQRPQDVSDDSWLKFCHKVVTFLSVLTAKHESILVGHSCFCEVYHAADILLYNQLTLWKNDSTQNSTRLKLIKSTLCLLHSCANVYSDGIPNSRRDHRHQLTLTNLEEFLWKDDSGSSFWSKELARIVKSEVKAIFEEDELS